MLHRFSFPNVIDTVDLCEFLTLAHRLTTETMKRMEASLEIFQAAEKATSDLRTSCTVALLDQTKKETIWILSTVFLPTGMITRVCKGYVYCSEPCKRASWHPHIVNVGDCYGS